VQGERLNYHAMRQAWCRHALRELLRRWGVYFVFTALAISAGAAGALSIMAAMAAWAVIPLFHAMTLAWPLATAATAAQALVGALVVWMLRPLLLPRRWLEAERALPLNPAEQTRSDLQLVTLALLPLIVLYGVGAAVVLARNPEWLRPVRALALSALVFASLASVVLGAAVLRARRQPRRGVVARRPSHSVGALGLRRWPWLLLALPLWRGPARRCGALLAAGALVVLLPAAGLWRWPEGGGWWLAALALAELSLATRLSTLVREEIEPLLAATAMLPLQPKALQRSAAWLPLAPLLPAWLALLAVLPPARPAVLAAFAMVSAGTAALQSFWAEPQSDMRAARWLLSLVVLLALASETLP
jgi:hypothetical protein